MDDRRPHLPRSWIGITGCLLIAWMIAGWIAITLLAPSARAQSTRDTTIVTATRIRSTIAGKIISITVTKIASLPTAGRVDTITITRTDTIRIPGPIVCPDSAMGPYVDTDYPSTGLDHTAYTGCGQYLGRVMSSDGLTWTAIPWHAAWPAKRFTAERQAMLYLVHKNTEDPLP